MCTYDDAKYFVLIVHGNGSLVYQLKEKTYANDGSDSIEVVLSENLQKDSSYTVQINISTIANWTSLQFSFGWC